MKKLIKRVTCFFFAVLVLCVCFPFSAFAVDPVSAGVMANAFAQAIAAYGAANGAAMTFDVSNTSSIGETVHELWADFRAGTQDADDYETLAAALFPDLYYKAVSAAGTAVEAATIGYNISSEYAEEFDNFWNWLLSGPAEMVKVDNSYQWSVDPVTGEYESTVVYRTAPFSSIPTIPAGDNPSTSLSKSFIYGVAASNSSYRYGAAILNQDIPCYILSYLDSNSNVIVVAFAGESFGARFSYYNGNSHYYNPQPASYADGAWYACFANSTALSKSQSYYAALNIPVYSSWNEAYSVINGWFANPTYESLSVGSYADAASASFPDTADPNYDAVAKRIPSDVPWDDSLFGDGTGTMTDAQSQAAAETADGVIERDKTLPLAGDQTTNPPSDDDPPSSDPDDYMVLGLEDVFPFCIPFDIYNFLAALSAAPVAPHFVCTLEFPDAIGGEQTIDIDFDTPVFNQLAQLLRTLELLAFIVGLALLTRSMFIRG